APGLSGGRESWPGPAVRRRGRSRLGRLFRLSGRAQIGRAHPGVPRFPRVEGAALEFLVSFDSKVRVGECGKLGRTSESGTSCALQRRENARFSLRAYKSHIDLRTRHGWHAACRVVEGDGPSHSFTAL